MYLQCTLLLLALLGPVQETPEFRAELVFPLDAQHNHAPGIVECPGGDLLVSWYRGSGERSADDVAVYGARLGKGDDEWSEAFLMADRPGFPDCNTCMMIDRHRRLWLFWPTILANSWESCLTNFKLAGEYDKPGCPRWDREGLILLKPDDFEEEANALLVEMLAQFGDRVSERMRKEIEETRGRLGEKLYQRLGWQPRCKPTVLPSGRILLPLYSDTFSISIMGENGPRNRIRVAESEDDGITWGPVGVSELPNPGSGLDGVRLANGHWLLVYNDTTEGRKSLAVSISDDEGRSWKWTRHLERHGTGSYHYPAVIQGADGTIQVVYSYFVEGGKSMKHAAFGEAWVLTGD
jgi:predicted neuraminidase